MWASPKKPSRDISAHKHWGRYSDKDDNLTAKKINSKKLKSHWPSHSSARFLEIWESSLTLSGDTAFVACKPQVLSSTRGVARVE